MKEKSYKPVGFYCGHPLCERLLEDGAASCPDGHKIDRTPPAKYEGPGSRLKGKGFRDCPRPFEDGD